jgi:hypothetical protein
LARLEVGSERVEVTALRSAESKQSDFLARVPTPMAVRLILHLVLSKGLLCQVATMYLPRELHMHGAAAVGRHLESSVRFVGSVLA